MAFLEDPRLRQRWNRLSHNAETVTENAAAGIWSLQRHHVWPFLAAIGGSFDACAGLCLGSADDRARRRRDRNRDRNRDRDTRYNFNFYDDWDAAAEEDDDDDDDDDRLLDGDGGGHGGGDSGALRPWSSHTWDRLLAGSGAAAAHSSGPGPAAFPDTVVQQQPGRKRGMVYGGGSSSSAASRHRHRTQGGDDDPTALPRTQSLSFLSRLLPFRLGRRFYKPGAAADRQNHPDRRGLPAGDETEPLLLADHLDYHAHAPADMALPLRFHPASPTLATTTPPPPAAAAAAAARRPPGPAAATASRKRSGTARSGTTADSLRSLRDLFPSDGEGDDDAVPLDDAFTIALDAATDDRSSARTRSSRGAAPAPAASSTPSSHSQPRSVEDVSFDPLHDLRRPASLMSRAQADGAASLRSYDAVADEDADEDGDEVEWGDDVAAPELPPTLSPEPISVPVFVPARLPHFS